MRTAPDSMIFRIEKRPIKVPISGASKPLLRTTNDIANEISERVVPKCASNGSTNAPNAP
jgi:hypothetical protein